MTTGWVLFGRDYKPHHGDPATELCETIRSAVIHPRHQQEGYLIHKPIGEYLRAAMRNLTLTQQELEGLNHEDGQAESD